MTGSESIGVPYNKDRLQIMKKPLSVSLKIQRSAKTDRRTWKRNASLPVPPQEVRPTGPERRLPRTWVNRGKRNARRGRLGRRYVKAEGLGHACPRLLYLSVSHSFPTLLSRKVTTCKYAVQPL